MRKLEKTFEQRFWEKVAIIPFHECWEWIGFKDANNQYGKFLESGITGLKRQVFAHRVSVILDNRIIPEGMVVDHICRNKGCVNPVHLRVVTPRINALENNSGPAAINAAKTHCIRNHPLIGDNLMNSKTRPTRRQCKKCAVIVNANQRKKKILCQ